MEKKGGTKKERRKTSRGGIGTEREDDDQTDEGRMGEMVMKHRKRRKRRGNDNVNGRGFGIARTMRSGHKSIHECTRQEACGDTWWYNSPKQSPNISPSLSPPIYSRCQCTVKRKPKRTRKIRLQFAMEPLLTPRRGSCVPWSRSLSNYHP